MNSIDVDLLKQRSLMRPMRPKGFDGKYVVFVGGAGPGFLGGIKAKGDGYIDVSSFLCDGRDVQAFYCTKAFFGEMYREVLGRKLGTAKYDLHFAYFGDVICLASEMEEFKEFVETSIKEVEKGNYSEKSPEEIFREARRKRELSKKVDIQLSLF